MVSDNFFKTTRQIPVIVSSDSDKVPPVKVNGNYNGNLGVILLGSGGLLFGLFISFCLRQFYKKFSIVRKSDSDKWISDFDSDIFY